MEAYEKSKLYKKNVKYFHDKLISWKELSIGQKLVSSILNGMTFCVTNVFPYGIMEIKNETIKPFNKSPTLVEEHIGDLSLIKPTFSHLHLDEG
ncbi:hypothetical protein CR513_37162, partial [Mucuna pruriens]